MIKSGEGFISVRAADQFLPYATAVLGHIIDGALMVADAVVKVILRLSCSVRM